MIDLDETARAISSTIPALHRTSENLSVKRFSEKNSVCVQATAPPDDVLK